MSSWKITPTGTTGTFFNTRVSINRIGTGGPGAYRVTLDGIEASELPNNGVVPSLALGRTLAIDTLRARAVKPAEQAPLRHAPMPPAAPPAVPSPAAVLELRVKCLELAIATVNGAMQPLAANEGMALPTRIKTIFRTADFLALYLGGTSGHANSQDEVAPAVAAK